jgi:superfamily II DNA or RNA helicase
MSEEEFVHQPFELRGYQQEAVAGVRKSWTQFDRSLGVAPTGSGKTIIFAEITEQRLARGGRVRILAHRGETANFSKSAASQLIAQLKTQLEAAHYG